MDVQNIVVPVAIASGSITFLVTISLVLIVTAIILARSKSGVYMYVCTYIGSTVMSEHGICPECN